MNIREAEPGDIYVDEGGKLWRVVGVFGEPAVVVQEVETTTPENPVRLTGGVSGAMWVGFKHIFRPKPPSIPEQYHPGEIIWR